MVMLAVLLLSVATDYTMLLIALSLLVAAAVCWMLVQLKRRLVQGVNRPTQAVDQSSSYCLVGVTYRKTWQSKDLI